MVCSFLSALPLCIWLCHPVPWKQDGHTWPRNFRSTYQGYWDNETLQLKRFCHLDIEQFLTDSSPNVENIENHICLVGIIRLQLHRDPNMIKNSNESLVFLVISRQPRNLLNAVFVNQTLRTASGDEELAFKQRQRDLKNYQNKVGLRLPGLLRNWWFLFLPAVSYIDIECKFCKKSSSLRGFIQKFSKHLRISWCGYPEKRQGSVPHNSTNE